MSLEPPSKEGVSISHVSPGQHTITVKDKTKDIKQTIDVTEPTQSEGLPQLQNKAHSSFSPPKRSMLIKKGGR